MADRFVLALIYGKILPYMSASSPGAQPSASIRAAQIGDEPHIARFIRDLARYEELEHHLDVCEERLNRHLFGEDPACSALIVEHDGEHAL